MEYSVDWFSNNIQIWEKVLLPLKNVQIEALEIGCFEGRATVWLLENVLTHPHSNITCIDTFKGSMEHKDIDFKAVKERFLHNTEKWRDKVDLLEGKSEDFLTKITKKFDIIYVDGSHESRDVLIDSVLSHLLLKPRGVIIFDDFLWRDGEESPYTPKGAVNAFFTCFSREYVPISVGYQLILQKKSI